MSILIGKITSTIFYNEDNGYLVGLFKVAKVEDESDQKYLRKTITITGNIIDLKLEVPLKIAGNFVYHEKFGNQFNFTSYELIEPAENDDIIDFLSSSFIKGCGRVTAEKIVSLYGHQTLEVIKENKFSLDKVDGMTEKMRDKIYESLINYNKSADLILKLKNLGFSIEEAGRIYIKYKDRINDIIDNNIYLLNDIIEFKRLDNIFLNNNNDYLDKRRVKACIIEVMKSLAMTFGSTYAKRSDIYTYLEKLFKISIDLTLFNEYLEELAKELFIVIIDDNIYLQEYYESEIVIAESLKKIDEKKITNYDYTNKINTLEKKINITYNEEQIKAIMSALNNNITIISGGPGVGKTTIINAIVKLYINKYHLNYLDILDNIALLAPTGRAAKKMSLATSLPAQTIHRFLKWNKDTNSFGVNEYNKNSQKLIIVDEVSMIDSILFASLLKGIYSNVKLILVGDAFQLPSVNPGLVLNDLITSDLFNYIPLNVIYRQSENSYIPYLAREIKNKDLSEEVLNKKDDYNFINVDSQNILLTIKKIITTGIEKGYDENNLQVLAPMYKGENGINNLNQMLCNIFNPDEGQDKINYGDVIYKVGDKVLQLVNDTDNNIFNGDIGFITRIYQTGSYKKEMLTIDFDGNIVDIPKKNLKNIAHAYAITIHKSQGSEFENVIMPVTYQYGSMLYNKLLYTAVSRAKKSLIIIGDPKAFYKGVMNDYGEVRMTSLKERLETIFIHKDNINVHNKNEVN